MELNLCVGEKGISVVGVKYTPTEIAREVVSQLGAKDVTVREGKVVRWIPNPYYDDFAEHTHDSPGRYEIISDSPDDIELTKAIQVVCKALKAGKGFHEKSPK